jgi:uncharacterized protein YjbI with pentapeptide repeats
MSLTAWKRRAEACHFEGESFEGLDLRSMKAFGSTFKDCSFRDCQFDLADWRASKFDGCMFVRCKLPLVNFATSFFEESCFVDCNLEQASFMGSQFRDVMFTDCRLAYGDTMFLDVTVKEAAVFLRCNLHGSNLNFREVGPKTLRFDTCNLWGVVLSMNCAFWDCTLDERTVKQFLALIARVAQDERIAELAGDQYAVVCRAMDGNKVNEKATTSTPILTPEVSTQTARN